jgi:LuxR family maltose regulon positive regulatory protein
VKKCDLSLDGKFTYPNSSEYLSFARYLLATGKYEDALQLLQRLLDRLISIDWRNLAYEAQLVQALAFQNISQTDKAVDVLSSVLEAAESEGYMRLFIDEGEPIAELLDITQKRGIHSQYVNKILSEMKCVNIGQNQSGKITGSSVAESLSEREIEVLRLLKTDLTSTEIAAELFVSANTARTHIKSIYNKLGVHNRDEAINIARQQGLM